VARGLDPPWPARRRPVAVNEQLQRDEGHAADDRGARPSSATTRRGTANPLTAGGRPKPAHGTVDVSEREAFTYKPALN